ncbi:MAG: glycosyltransferase family 2 protein [Chitinophagaceae bacterium]|nr:glycosyltransferase family 2 protein [Chitinophagaceae bacterium]
MLLSVIIVNYNVKYFLEHCLLSVLKAGTHIAMEVIVVDNHSVDGSRAYLQPAFPQVNFTWLNKNAGFAKACNLGLGQATGEYILFLNPDTIVPEDCFEKCIEFFRSKPGAGALGVRMTDGKGVFLRESKRGFPSLTASFFKFSGMLNLFPRSPFFARYYMGNLPENEMNTVAVLSGACMFIPARVLKITGGFDEAFFMYGEDIDLSYRIQKAGYENYYYPGVTIVHFKGESTVKTSRKHIYTFYNAMCIFVRKHYPRLQSVLYSCLIRLLMLVSMQVTICRNIFSSRKKMAVANEVPGSFLITGADNEFQHAETILHAAGKTGKNIQLRDWPDGNDKNKGGNLIVCQGHFSFKAIIQQLPALAAHYRVWFCTAGGRSIISSSSKNESGATVPDR